MAEGLSGAAGQVRMAHTYRCQRSLSLRKHLRRCLTEPSRNHQGRLDSCVKVRGVITDGFAKRDFHVLAAGAKGYGKVWYQFDEFELRVAERVPLQEGRNPHNEFYLSTKANKLDHLFKK